MFHQPFPEAVDPRQFAEQRRQLRGRVAISEMPRLADLVGSEAGSSEAELSFEIGEGRRPEIRGWVRGEVERICQRCLQRMPESLSAEFELTVVDSDEEAERLSADRDPLVANKRAISIAALLEDELILALPIIALHPSGSPCAEQAAAAAEQAGPVEPQRKNPFAVLASLKRKD